MNAYSIIRGIGMVYAKLFYRIEFHGRENVPEDGACIAIANHSSFADPFAVACAIKRQTFFVAKSDLAKNGFLRWVLNACGAVTINRGESDIAALRKVCEIVNKGNIAGIFPQGTRIPCEAPDAETVQAGIGLIAGRSKAPLLPIAICYGKKNKKPMLFRKLHVYVGKPVSYEEYALVDGERASSHDIAKYGFEKVCSLFKEHNYG